MSLHRYRSAWAERAKICGMPERFAQEALGHDSKAGHRAYAKRALMKIWYQKCERPPRAACSFAGPAFWLIMNFKTEAVVNFFRLASMNEVQLILVSVAVVSVSN